MKARKLPVEVEVVQLTWGTWTDICDLMGQEAFDRGAQGVYVDKETGKVTNDANGEIGLIIPTLEGDMLARENDWIVKGVNGEFYPCKPDIFSKTYELIDRKPFITPIFNSKTYELIDEQTK